MPNTARAGASGTKAKLLWGGGILLAVLLAGFIARVITRPSGESGNSATPSQVNTQATKPKDKPEVPPPFERQETSQLPYQETPSTTNPESPIIPSPDQQTKSQITKMENPSPFSESTRPSAESGKSETPNQANTQTTKPKEEAEVIPSPEKRDTSQLSPQAIPPTTTPEPPAPTKSDYQTKNQISKMEIPSPSPERSPDKNNARIALVDYNKILKDYSKAINSKKEMEVLASDYQKERNEREADLRRSSGEALQLKQREMAAFGQTASKILEDKRQRLTQELTADVNQALASLAKNSCDLVFVKPEIPSPGALIFAADFPEVSDQLLERLNNPDSSFVSSISILPKTPRIAVVDYNKVLKNYSKAVKSQRQMEELASNYQKERNEREADLRTSSGEALQLKQREMAAFGQTASKILEDKRQRLTQELTADMNQALASVAKDSCELIFVTPQVPSPGALIFAADFPEVSDQILERLNNPGSAIVSSISILPKTPRIAVVDYNKVLKNYSKAVRSQKQMEELASNYQKERNEREADLRRSSGEALQLKQREMAAFGQTASKILEDKRQRLTQELTADINQALASVAKDSCDLVFVRPEIPSPGALIFASHYPDITDRVLEELDRF